MTQDASFDAVRLEVIWSRLISIVDEAAKAIVRTSFSTLSNEANDFACVLTDSKGHSVAQNTGAIPSFIATLPATVRHFIDAFGYDDINPGDVFITNDPWMGTGHLSDVCLVKPVFLGEKLVAFASTTAHVPDIGGRLRAIESRQIFEEGFQIPLMKLVDGGSMDRTLVRLLRQNVRTPEQTLGDIWAQLSANELMARRVTELLSDYGLDELDSFTGEILSAETMTNSSYPGVTATVAQAEQSCLAAFQRISGVDFFADPTWDMTFLYPTQESWDRANDRDILCVVTPLNGQPTTLAFPRGV